MIQTFKDLRDAVLRRLDEAGDTSSTYNLVNDLLNTANYYRAVQVPEAFLITDASFTTVGSIRDYALPEDFMRPLYWYNTTHNRYLEEVPDRQLAPEGYDPAGQTTSVPVHFMLWGRTQVKAQPITASVLYIVSDSASDDATAPQILIRGERSSDGQMVSEILTPSGLTPVQSYYTYRKIAQVTRAGGWTGNMTMTDASGAILLTLLPGEVGKSYPLFHFVETPSEATTINYRYYRAPVKMYNDYDQPDIPAPFSEILIYDTLVQMAGYNSEMNATALSVWKDQQLKWQEALIQNYTEGQSLHSRVRFVRPYGEAAPGGVVDQLRRL